MIKEIKTEAYSAQASRKNILGFLVALTAVIVFLDWRIFEFGQATLIFTIILAALFIVAFFIRWQIFIPLFRLWMFLAMFIGWFVLRFILVVLYVVLIVPIGIMFRIIGKDPLNRKFQASAESYWEDADWALEKSKYLRKF